jgi:hypothetical protein
LFYEKGNNTYEVEIWIKNMNLERVLILTLNSMSTQTGSCWLMREESDDMKALRIKQWEEPMPG